MDTLTRAERSDRMARIGSRNTKPEMQVRRLLHGLGYRYCLHRRDLPGSPDLVFPARKMVVFVHGCFWHAHESCSIANRPKTRQAYWDEKFARNKVRDQKNRQALQEAGWYVHTVWECEVKDETSLLRGLVSFLGPPGKSKTIAAKRDAMIEDGNGT